MGILDTLLGRRPTVDNRQDGPLGDWCAAHGWTYQRRNDQIVETFTGLPGFRNNSGTQAWHLMHGRHREHAVHAFHYCYQTETTDNRGRRSKHGHWFQVVSVRTPAVRPTLTVSKEPWDSKFDLDLDDDQFNDNFKVKIDDRQQRFAFGVLHAPLMRWLLADERAVHRKWPFRFERDHLYTWDTWQDTPEPEPILERADYLVDILERVPASVWRH